jgi:hypothetical protein
MKEYFNEWFAIGVALTVLLFFRKFRELFREVYGTVDKVEFGGFLFFAVFLWMLWVKTHKPEVFSDALIIFVGCVAITGLGLTVVFKHLKELKNFKDDIQDKGQSEELP